MPIAWPPAAMRRSPKSAEQTVCIRFFREEAIRCNVCPLSGVSWASGGAFPAEARSDGKARKRRSACRGLRRRASFALPDRQDDTRVVCTLSPRLFLLLAANSGKSLADIGVDALGVAEGRIENRFHRSLHFRVVRYAAFGRIPCKSHSL